MKYFSINFIAFRIMFSLIFSQQDVKVVCVLTRSDSDCPGITQPDLHFLIYAVWYQSLVSWCDPSQGHEQQHLSSLHPFVSQINTFLSSRVSCSCFFILFIQNDCSKFMDSFSLFYLTLFLSMFSVSVLQHCYLQFEC